MAIRIMGSGNNTRHSGYREYLVDTPADLASLPSTPDEIAWGATAEVISTGDTYVLNSEFFWMPVMKTGSSGTSGTINPNSLLSSDVNNVLVLGSDGRLYVPLAQGSSLTHIQNTASATWTISHNLNQRYVDVQVIDSAGNSVWASIEYTSTNVVTIGFSAPIVGTAVIRR